MFLILTFRFRRIAWKFELPDRLIYLRRCYCLGHIIGTMSRRAKGFQYLSGKYLEMTPSGDQSTMSSNCRSLSSLVSSSSDDPLLTSNSRRPDLTDANTPRFNPIACRRSFDVTAGPGPGTGGGSADRVLMRQRPTAAAAPRRAGSRGGMPGISWSSDRRYSVSDLVRDYSGRFPVIVKVAQGYYGDGNLKLPVGQVR